MKREKTNLRNVFGVKLTEVCVWLWGVQEDGTTHEFSVWVTVNELNEVRKGVKLKLQEMVFSVEFLLS